MLADKPKFLIIADGDFSPMTSKTANSVIRYLPDRVVGVDFVRRARELTSKPLVAIGGITAERAEEVYRAGADSLAVSSDLMTSEDPRHRVGEYLAAARRVVAERAGAQRIGSPENKGGG